MTTNNIAKKQPVDLPTTIDGLRDLFERANAGDESVLPQVREVLKLDPEIAILMLHSDLVADNQAALIRWLPGDNEAHYAAIQKQAEMIRVELCCDSPSPLERILVDRIVTCWLQVQMGDQQCFETDGLTLKQVKHREQVRDRAHCRLLRAIYSLAKIRKLALPVLQVNVAGRQVNLAG